MMCRDPGLRSKLYVIFFAWMDDAIFFAYHYWLPTYGVSWIAYVT